MAIYNAPVDVKDHATDACNTALEMIHKLKSLNSIFKANNLPEVSIGIGINTAEVSVGNMGSAKRFNYTVIGDGVNLTSRVESLTKEYGVDILITESTKQQLDASFLLRPLEHIKVRGKEEAVMVYELLENSESNRIKIKKFVTALDLYNAGSFVEAKACFSALVDSDKVSTYFITKMGTR